MAKTKADAAPPLPPGVPPDGAPVGGSDSSKAPPPFGTPKPAGKGELPRVVSELARAGRGETRFKIVARHANDSCKARYVLADAGDKAGAEACYLKAEGLADLPADSRLVTTELPD